MQMDRHVLRFILFPVISCFKRKHLSVSVCLTPARPVPVEHLHMLSQHLAQVCSSDGNWHLSASDHLILLDMMQIWAPRAAAAFYHAPLIVLETIHELSFAAAHPDESVWWSEQMTAAGWVLKLQV